MTGLYLTDLADWLRAAGLAVVEWEGWQYRAKASGGYSPGRPWCVMWHHDASSPASSILDVVAYEATGADAAPITNLHVDRDGTVYVVAAGPTNTNGEGGPFAVTRGVVPADAMNSYAVGVEISNNGTGEPYPVDQVDAAMTVSLTLAGRLGLDAADVCTHQVWAPGRKIDPARADAVTGTWQPRPVTSAGTWSLESLVLELQRRALTPTPPNGDAMACTLYELTDADAVFVGLAADGVGTELSWCDPGRADRYRAIPTVVRRPTTRAELTGMILLGRLPADDTQHNWSAADFYDHVT